MARPRSLPIGRTGRAERSGEAFTLITAEDAPMVKAINNVIGGCVEQRMIADVDYDVPLASPAKKASTHTNRPQPASWKRAPHPGSSGRARKGAPAFSSPSRTGRAGRNDKA